MAIIAPEQVIQNRQAEKQASRRRDAVRLKQGVNPEEIQKKNSVFNAEVVKSAKIHNLADIVGK